MINKIPRLRRPMQPPSTLPSPSVATPAQPATTATRLPRVTMPRVPVRPTPPAADKPAQIDRDHLVPCINNCSAPPALKSRLDEWSKANPQPAPLRACGGRRVVSGNSAQYEIKLAPRAPLKLDPSKLRRPGFMPTMVPETWPTTLELKVRVYEDGSFESYIHRIYLPGDPYDPKSEDPEYSPRGRLQELVDRARIAKQLRYEQLAREAGLVITHTLVEVDGNTLIDPYNPPDPVVKSERRSPFLDRQAPKFDEDAVPLVDSEPSDADMAADWDRTTTHDSFYDQD